MAERLIDKIQQQESNNIERPVRRSNAVTQITAEGSGKDHQISAKVNTKIYKQFTDINRAQGISNNSALNMLINKYVRDNKGILENEQ